MKYNLDHLTEEEKAEVVAMLSEESEIFSKFKNDIGHIPDFNLDIHPFPVNGREERYKIIFMRGKGGGSGNLLGRDFFSNISFSYPACSNVRFVQRPAISQFLISPIS